MKKRILVVDDEWSIRELLKFRLSQRGFEVSTAKDEAEFMQQVTNQPPHLILLDIWLGGKIGTDIYSHLLQKGLASNLPVIFITALVENPPPKRATSGGRYSLFAKPFDFEELMEEIHRLLASADVQESKDSVSK